MSYAIAVRALCEFTAKAGDLDLRFTPAPTAQEGITGHQAVTARRASGYQAEISLSGQYQNLLVRGRADGYDPDNNRLEEIKTYRGDLARMPANHRALHWAQLKVYGHMLCQQRQLKQLELALVYYDINRQKETLLTETHSAASLQQYFETLCGRFTAWADQELQHQLQRNQQLQQLGFPYPHFRPGQRNLAEAVYKAASTCRHLLAQAPTGLGKTVATLFPLLKAMPVQQLDKLFFLTAKTPGRRLALDSLSLLQQGMAGGSLRTLELVARDKACEHPDKACHGDACPLAQGFYDRLPAARAAAVGLQLQDQANLRGIALAHQVCPYYLSQEMARWSDVVVGDYNYFFDTSALLHGLAQAQQWQVGVLVDEAHNLVDRARKMYSATLDQAAFRLARKQAPKVLRKTLDRLHRSWKTLTDAQQTPYQAHPTLPDTLLHPLQQAISAITDHLVEQPLGLDPTLQQFYFDALHFTHLAEVYDLHSQFDSTLSGTHSRQANSILCLRNILPAPFLQPRFASTRSTTLFSATLSPWHYYADTLGLPPDTGWINVDSPFQASQLQVRLVNDISTRYPHRQASLTPICNLVAQQYHRHPGNYLAFFSSFDYLQQVSHAFQSCHPLIPTWQQARRMDESERQGFLAHFVPGGQGIGFAVLGGAFAEGIDLAGDRLIGAFVATLGLPQFNPVNEQIMQRMGTLFGTGYEYAYLYPGLQKVVQAAGRVIRTQQDQGYVYLIDDRYCRPEIQALLPTWWDLQLVSATQVQTCSVRALQNEGQLPTEQGGR
ncbi:hypothetical protein GCM10007907_27680 [Chitinimonas prasina]|uniref:Helicase ATP-binding domain-containing protein n=1 Tax=Chitinimonas prasina TaxID=1434937 RepID=A0ABQ5YHQ2_9NEIS|nr:ATP-dependent DNA helicase [Chitinimonas prasina]GLR13978.1 hypothetical protein GCM10007907_27680 [Chitinimonas prasina]